MTNYWKLPGIPHKGWTLVDVIDVREDDQEECETEYEICMMCGNDKIRYVHIVEHEKVEEQFRVGCICAMKMTEDYISPRRRENELKNKAERRKNWINKHWRMSKNGNYYLNIDGHHLLVFHDKCTKKIKGLIDDEFDNNVFKTLGSAKIALFIMMESKKANGEWYPNL